MDTRLKSQNDVDRATVDHTEHSVNGWVGGDGTTAEKEPAFCRFVVLAPATERQNDKMPECHGVIWLQEEGSLLCLPSLPSPIFRLLADLRHQLVERLVIAGRKGKEGIWSLKHSLPHGLRDLFRQQEKFDFISVESLSQPVDQGLTGIVAVGHRPGLDPAQVREANVNLRGQTSKR